MADPALPKGGEYLVTVLAKDTGNPLPNFDDLRIRISKQGSFELDLKLEEVAREVQGNETFTYIAYKLGGDRFFILPSSDHARKAKGVKQCFSILIRSVGVRKYDVGVDDKDVFSLNNRIVSLDIIHQVVSKLTGKGGSGAYYTQPATIAQALSSSAFENWYINRRRIADMDIEYEKKALRENQITQFITNELEKIQGILGPDLFKEIILKAKTMDELRE